MAGADEKAGVILRLADITAIRSVMRQREEALQLLTHDIRAPLTSILAVLQTDAGTAAGESIRIDAHVRRALALADGYIQLARAESYRYRPEQVDLGQVMLDAADEIWPQAQQKSIALKTDAVADDLIVNGDPSLIARAIINVLDNAVKHSPEGSTITLSSKAQGGEILFTVDDEGPGMDQAEAETLFQAFRQGGARNKSGGGVGLGLAVVLTVMKRHGGEAAVSPAPTGGARITLRFPAAHREDAG